MESSEFNPDFSAGPSDADTTKGPADGAPASPADVMAAHAPPYEQKEEPKPNVPDAQIQQKVHDVLHSDIGVNTLLNRLKASIASARVCCCRMAPYRMLMK